MGDHSQPHGHPLKPGLRVSSCLHSAWACSSFFCKSAILTSILFNSESDTSGKFSYQFMHHEVDRYCHSLYHILCLHLSKHGINFQDNMDTLYIINLYLISNIDLLFAISLFLEFSFSHQLVEGSLNTLKREGERCKCRKGVVIHQQLNY